MALIWDKAQNYSNQSPGDIGNNPNGYPGFWFGPRTVPNPQSGTYRTTLSANAQLSQSQPVYSLAVSGGARITAAGDNAQVVMDIPYSDIKAVVNVSYVGQFSYKYVVPPTPATIAEFQLNSVSFVDGQGHAVPSSTTTGTSSLANAVATGRGYLYLQLFPHTGTDSLNQINPATPGSPVTLSDITWDYDSAAPNLEIACFLSGTMIATPNGPKAVESLAVGELVLTGLAPRQKAETVRWIGRGHVEADPSLPDDRAGYPVCIRKDALAPNIPDADLRLTPEHTLYFDGRLVPVRMLVNHRSIFYDHTQPSYDYYHFEMEAHSIVHAANLPTESYLDTGSRRSFQEMQFLEQDNIVTLPPPRTWEKDACAPLGVEAAFVRPLYQTLERRARSLGLPRMASPPKLTDESDFHLITDRGESLYAIRRVRDRALFFLPEGISTLRLVSRASRPCDTIGPFMDDRRQLGVLVGTMELYQNGQTHCLTHHLTDQNAPGWDILEATPCRWTRGKAILSLSGIPIHERDMLAIQILAEGPYIDTSPAAIHTITLPRAVATL